MKALGLGNWLSHNPEHNHGRSGRANKGMYLMRSKVTQEMLLNHLHYNGGKIYWRARGNGTFDKNFAGKEAGCTVKYGYKLMSYNGGNILVHVAIWIMLNGDIPENMEIDHINNDPSDNRIENLRLATRTQNCFNMRKRVDNTSGVKGVMWNKNNNNWRARIYVNKTKIEIGSFDTIDEARIAINSARQRLHGEYANSGHKEAA